MLNSLLSLPAAVGEGFRSLDATPFLAAPVKTADNDFCVCSRNKCNVLVILPCA